MWTQARWQSHAVTYPAFEADGRGLGQSEAVARGEPPLPVRAHFLAFAAIAARLETGSCPAPTLCPDGLPATGCGSDFFTGNFLFPPRPLLPGHYSVHRYYDVV